ncbi:hypothetical protein K488DRAFT_85225 [Vararia minispora EC-137]|uniref:Uncharacterized protein n=1 Tax=Vararia minispora EC-137 TaxID=1314806 RepID=A0ACB8QMI1_9AGAM|nr:hypothetical protein K488DRAFT_85225 [Vararia minispora EC-137]
MRADFANVLALATLAATLSPALAAPAPIARTAQDVQSSAPTAFGPPLDSPILPAGVHALDARAAKALIPLIAGGLASLGGSGIANQFLGNKREEVDALVARGQLDGWTGLLPPTTVGLTGIDPGAISKILGNKREVEAVGGDVIGQTLGTKREVEEKRLFAPIIGGLVRGAASAVGGDITNQIFGNKRVREAEEKRLFAPIIGGLVRGAASAVGGDITNQIFGNKREVEPEYLLAREMSARSSNDLD